MTYKDIFFFENCNKIIYAMDNTIAEPGYWKCLRSEYEGHPREMENAEYNAGQINKYVLQGTWEIVDDFLPYKFDFVYVAGDETYTATRTVDGDYDLLKHDTNGTTYKEFGKGWILQHVNVGNYKITKLHREMPPVEEKEEYTILGIVQEINTLLAKATDYYDKLEIIEIVKDTVVSNKAKLALEKEITTKKAELEALLSQMNNL